MRQEGLYSIYSAGLERYDMRVNTLRIKILKAHKIPSYLVISNSQTSTISLLIRHRKYAFHDNHLALQDEGWEGKTKIDFGYQCVLLT